MENITNIEEGRGDYAEQILEWGQLAPPLNDIDLPTYLLLAASLRGQTVEEAALPAELRALADRLTDDSSTIRNGAISDALKLELGARAVLARHVAFQLRQERTIERQKALAESLSGLGGEPAVAQTVAEELVIMDPATVLTPVPLALLAKNQPAELVAIVRNWSADELTQDRTRMAAVEALKEVK